MSNKKLILAGCSYTIDTWFGGAPFEIPYTFGGFLHHNHNLNVEHIAVSGNSNDASIRQVYDFVKNNNIKDSTVVFQTTHLHRIGGHFNFTDDWINLQPRVLESKTSNKLENESFTLDNFNTYEVGDDEIYGTQLNLKNLDKYKNLSDDYFWKSGDSSLKKKVIEYYQLWLQFKYDDFIEFKELMFKLDLLKGYLSQFNNQMVLIYWPDIYPKYIPYLEERNFFNINREYSMMRWSKINNVIGDDTHLKLEGHKLLSKELYEHLILNKNV
jgi:hypothetical protein